MDAQYPYVEDVLLGTASMKDVQLDELAEQWVKDKVGLSPAGRAGGCGLLRARRGAACLEATPQLCPHQCSPSFACCATQEFTIGSHPPRLAGIKSYNTPDDEVMLETPIIWGSNSQVRAGCARAPRRHSHRSFRGGPWPWQRHQHQAPAPCHPRVACCAHCWGRTPVHPLASHAASHAV